MTCTCTNFDESSQTPDDSKLTFRNCLLDIYNPFIAFLSYSTTDTTSESITQQCSMSFATINKDAEVKKIWFSNFKYK